MAVGWEVSFLLIRMTRYYCTNSYPAIFFLIRFLAVRWNIESKNLPDEVVNLWIFTVGLTSSGCWPHTSSVWPWSGVPKVRLYDTFLGGLPHLPPRMKNQHGLNEGKKHIGKKIISHLSACDVTHVVSLDTNNLKRKSLWEWRKLCLLRLSN